MEQALEKVGTVRPRRGEWVRGRLRVGVYPDGRTASIPLLVGRGRAAGPTVGIVCGAHGDEINGPEAIGRLIPTLSPKSFKGTILVLPLMNPWGFAARTRAVSIDGRDLNRSYPGHPQGSFTLQVAHAILSQVVAHADALIDVHDAGTRNMQLPHTRVHMRPEDDPTRALGLAFGSDIVILRNAESGMLAGVARSRFGIPALTVEVGGAYQIWESFQWRAVQGLRNLLRSLQVLPGKLELPTIQRLVRKHRGLSGEQTGIQTTFVRIGQFVAPGQPLYRIYNPQDGSETVRKAHACGIVLGKNIMGHISRGGQAVDVLGFKACGEGAEMQGTLIRNRRGTGVVTFAPSIGWGHVQHARKP